jgi:hypothetical protein
MSRLLCLWSAWVHLYICRDGLLQCSVAKLLSYMSVMYIQFNKHHAFHYMGCICMLLLRFLAAVSNSRDMHAGAVVLWAARFV